MVRITTSSGDEIVSQRGGEWLVVYLALLLAFVHPPSFVWPGVPR
jgi:hypothetical protein